MLKEESDTNKDMVMPSQDKIHGMCEIRNEAAIQPLVSNQGADILSGDLPLI